MKPRASAPHLEPAVESEPPVMPEPSLVPELPVAPEPEVVAVASPKESAPVRRPTRWRGPALAAAAVLAIVALGFQGHPSAPTADDEPAVPQQAAVMPAPLEARAVAPPEPQPVVRKPPRTASAVSTKSVAPITASTAVSKKGIPVEATPAPREPDAIAPPAPALISTVASVAAPVTITGCLEVSVSHDEFRLTETDGADAPRSRSWRTGFFKKRSTPVALVEAPDTLALQSQVGRRVAATGMLTSHDLKVSGLRVVGPSCN